ncbi:hypothetical protein UK23_13040 [Lentzea aerocolonigenes]|uniref:Uncharacterized protein n=1 Tax=Lentzea aerocolonigenes TaxID=68170 RepID=A0A0F0H2D1_LENAE|nr:hypothetical protein [Lentzea aerocolonigenes]KJK49670.1 hypothetical protein UK23_13040 [Lentzea aerocolonigenes]
MTPESLAAVLDTMPQQRQAIADGEASAETYEAVALRVAVFERPGRPSLGKSFLASNGFCTGTNVACAAVLTPR